MQRMRTVAGFYLTWYKVAPSESSELLLPGERYFILPVWLESYKCYVLTFNASSSIVCMWRALYPVITALPYALGRKGGSCIWCLMLGRTKYLSLQAWKGQDLLGTERQLCIAQRIPNRGCPRSSKHKKINKNTEQAVNIVVRRLLFSSYRFMASVPALSILCHCCSGPAQVVVSWVFLLFVVFACQHSTNIIVWHLLKPPPSCIFFPSGGVTRSWYSDGLYWPLNSLHASRCPPTNTWSFCPWEVRRYLGPAILGNALLLNSQVVSVDPTAGSFIGIHLLWTQLCMT